MIGAGRVWRCRSWIADAVFLPTVSLRGRVAMPKPLIAFIYLLLVLTTGGAARA